MIRAREAKAVSKKSVALKLYTVMSYKESKDERTHVFVYQVDIICHLKRICSNYIVPLFTFSFGLRGTDGVYYVELH